MLLAAFALSLSVSPVLIEKSPDDIVCRSKIDRRTKMRGPKICKTRAEWEGKYEEEDAALAAGAPLPRTAEQVSTAPKPQ
ncbi:hypothetical protein FPZ54_15355 [Sphingomonas suaedae]|uniref:Uncharacterized protein n=1 Tax=Sphingomonas suaedae TaxID=2599297 RepID=A0A518RII2_9SPHN|nr:hypothetical protein [Sphingomonas suaedae]QDX27244.1 hypothetical protein FPZ54_15355 [Sphingomonas suaedae]